MKKNISINIGGIIFHIEEDGYNRLKQYLDSINKYFSSFEDSKEIIEDIENRIAEIFMSKLTDGNQVIGIEDIEEVMTTMGTVADFEATIETDQTEQTQEEPKAEKKTESSSESEFGGATEYKKLFRDQNHRVLGGVAAGIANYFGIDPIWIRLLILALFFNILFWGLSGATLIAYIILWIVLPPSFDLQEDKSIKKLYRNSSDRVLGGVASGIAAYFGTDTTVIRLLFVLSIILGGAGIILYVILWIITPEALTITEKMQMQGEPVTLSNIETNIKKSLKVEEGEENAFVKVLLFPFRLIAMIITGLAQLLGPFLNFVVEALRVLFGLIVVLLGFSFMISIVMVVFVLLGVSFAWTDHIYLDEFPIEFLFDSMSWFAAGSVFLVLFVPALAITLLGISVILKRQVGNAYFGWTLLGVWLVGIAGAAFFVPSAVRDFSVENDHKREIIFDSPSGVPTLKLGEEARYDDYDGVRLKLRGHSDSTFKAVIRVESRGSSRQAARENAEMIEYNIVQDGDDFVFDSEMDFGSAPFRFQEVDIIMYVPFGKTFRMDSELEEILRNTLHLNGYRSRQIEGNEWSFDRDGIQCLTCEPVQQSRSRSRSDRERARERSDNERYDARTSRALRSWNRVRGETISYEFADFKDVSVSSLFNVKVVRGDEYKVEVTGEDTEEVYLKQRGNQLTVEHKRDWDWFEQRDWDTPEINILIQAPDLRSLELTGGCRGEIRGFNPENFEITLTGAAEVDAEMDARFLDVNLTGASRLNLKGNGRQLEARVVGASRLDAYDFKSEKVDASVLGASKANLYASEELGIDAGGVSTVYYSGTDNAVINSDGLSTVKRR